MTKTGLAFQKSRPSMIVVSQEFADLTIHLMCRHIAETKETSKIKTIDVAEPYVNILAPE